MDVADFAARPEDLEGLRQAKTELAPKKRQARTTYGLPPKGDRYIRGPIPLDWLRAASRCGERGVSVALLLWHAVRWQKQNPARLTPTVLAELGVHPKTARRALVEFQRMGLVDVEFHRGRAPRVRVLAAPEASTDE